MREIVVYSKPNCPYCVKAKRLLDQMELPFTERVVGVDATREQLLEAAPNARTVPQIIIDDKVIGGYDQLATYIETTGFNGTGYSL
jgi:glutaredoxin 3